MSFISIKRHFQLIWLICFVTPLGNQILNAKDFYVSLNGSDLSGDGSFSSPWHSLSFAINSIPEGINALHVDQGAYDIPQTLNLKDGLSVLGQGIGKTIFKNGGAQTVFSLYSGISKNSACSLSNFTIIGGEKDTIGIEVTSRSNVTIERVHFEECAIAGILAFSGSDDPFDNASLLRNLTIRYCEFKNCGRFEGSYSGGSVQIGNLDGLLFHNNEILVSKPGSYGLKFAAGGYFKNCKIFNNRIHVKWIKEGPWAGSGFAIELFRLMGNNEIYNNELNGPISLVGGSKMEGDFSVRVHNNKILETEDNLLKFAVECVLSDLVVDHNEIQISEGKAFVFWATGNSFDDPASRSNIRIFENTISDAGRGESESGLAYLPSWNRALLENISIFRNTTVGTDTGIYIQFETTGRSIRNIKIHNNRFHRISGPVFQTSGDRIQEAEVHISNNQIEGSKSLIIHHHEVPKKIDLKKNNFINYSSNP